MASSKHGEIILKSMYQTKEKYDSLVLSRSHLWMVWRCHDIPRVHCYYYLELTVRKETWMRTTSATVMVDFFESSILKDTWSQLCSEFLPNILKDTLQLNILRTWINIRAKSFIKTSINIMKSKSMQVPGKRSVAKKSKHAILKNIVLK